MRKLRPGAWHLAALAGGLAFVAFIAWTYHRDQPASSPDLAFLLVMLLLELPAFWWRRRGGGPTGTLAAAILPPLVLFEGLLGWGAWRYRDAGGDLQGIEPLLMALVPIPILATGAAVATLAMLLIAPGDAED